MLSKMAFRSRRRLMASITVIAVALVWMIAWMLESRLSNASVFTGAVVLASIFVLMTLGARRRMPTIPLGSMSTWTQIHIYVGLFSVGVYAIHVPALVVGGFFETSLAILFLVVAASGMYGLYASRTLPRLLTPLAGEPRYDAIHWHREQIATSAKGLLLNLEDENAQTVLGNYYGKQLQHFFGSRPSMAYMIMPSGSRRRRLLHDLKELHRYLSGDGKQAAGQYAALIRKRDDLDYQFALQFRLRAWLVVHCVFSILLLIGGIVHGVLAWRFAM